MKRMRLRKKKKRKFTKMIFIILIFSFVFKYTMDIISYYKLDVSNKEFIELILSDASYINKYEENKYNLFNKTLTLLTNLNIKKPVNILKSVMHYDYEEPTFNEEIEEPTVEIKPRVYIYNTHQTERYSNVGFENYNLNPDVLMASYLLQENLRKYNIESIVEERSVPDFLNTNGWNYAASYKATRYFLEDTLSDYEFDLIIDLHRDALTKEKSTITINGKDYAKVLFVVGTAYDNFKPNLDLSKTLSTLINSEYPNLSRGVITKSGKGVNGIYNQDLGDNIILLEVGGQHNKVSEVMNTIEVVASIISSYLEE